MGQCSAETLGGTADPWRRLPLQIRYWKAGAKAAAAERVRTAGLDTSALSRACTPAPSTT